jgi:hypothetical protein
MSRTPRTHCRKGQEYAVVGYWTNGTGQRYCKLCALARGRKRRALARETEPRLMCSACDRKRRRPDQYVCGECNQSLPGGPAFNVVRPPEMQGRAVSVFAPWNQHA